MLHGFDTMIIIILVVNSLFQFMRYKTKDRSENNSEVVIPIIEPLRIILSEIAALEKEGLVFPSILKGKQMKYRYKKQ